MIDVPVTLNFRRLMDSTVPAYSGWIQDQPGTSWGKEPTRKRYGVLEGSSGSSKTISIIQYLTTTHLLQRDFIRVDCFRHDQATCNDSVIADFRMVLGPDMLDIWDDKRWNEQKKQYRFENGSMMRFRGCREPGKLHGPRRDIAWLNEVTEISYAAFRQINARTNDFILMDFNPSLSVHWVFERILKQGAARVDHFHSTFKDNPFISAEAASDIRSWEPTLANKMAGTADHWAWQVYGLGQRARREGAIFENWTTMAGDIFPSNPLAFQRHGYGLDFGYSQDPTAVVECILQGDVLFLRELVYETGLITTINQSNPDKPSLEYKLIQMEQEGLFDRSLEGVGDCAAAEAIDDLQSSKFNFIPCEKGAGSIQYGVTLLKQFRIVIHEDSINLQREFENYAWKKDKAGDFTDEPIDDFNHAIDGTRYWAKRNLKPRIMAKSRKKRRPSGRKKNIMKSKRRY